MTFWVLTFLFLLSRVLHLLFCFPEFSPEDIVLGTLPKELIEGLKIPFFDYAVTHYHGGTLVYGVLTVPFFLLFGKSVFALRLTAILFQLGAFVTWYLFIKRFFGKTPALYTALLYLFSPSWLTLFSMFANGSHTESLFFTAVGLFLLYRILYEKSHSLRDSLLLGLVCGFGSYFTYGILVSTLSLLLFWVCEDRKIFKKREFFLFCLFFVIGVSPWVVYNLLYQFHGVDVTKEGFAYSYSQQIFIIPFRFLKTATLRVAGLFSFNFRERGNYFHPHMTLLNVLYYLTLLFSYLLLYRFEKTDKKAHFLFLFPLLYLGVTSLSQFGSGIYFSPYLVPLYPFFFAVIALGLTRLGSFSKGLRRVSVSILVLLLLMGLKGELNLLSLREYKLSLKYRGYSYRQLGWVLLGRYLGDPEQISTMVKKMEGGLSDLERFEFYYGLSTFVYRFETQEDLQKYFPWLKRFEKKYQPFFLEELGYSFGFSEGPFPEKLEDAIRLLDKDAQPYFIAGLVSHLSPNFSGMKQGPLLTYALRQMDKLSPENQRTLAYAVGKLSWKRSTEASFLGKLKSRRHLENRFPPELLPLYYRGVGALMMQGYNPFFQKWPFPLEQKLKGIDEKYQEAIYWGAGFEAPLLYEDPFEYERMIRGIPEEFRETFKKGLQDRLSWGGRNYWIEGKDGIVRRDP